MTEKTPKPKLAERGTRFMRNINALGAVACFGLAMIASPLAASALNAYGALNAGQAVSWHALGKHLEKKKKARKR